MKIDRTKTPIEYCLDGDLKLNKINVSVTNLSGYTCATNNSISIGEGALPYITSSGGTNNIGIGYQSLFNNISGSGNVSIGRSAGRSITGNTSIFIGYQAGLNETNSNKIYIGCGDAFDNYNTLIYGEIDNKILCINGTLCADNISVTGTSSGTGVVMSGNTVCGLTTYVDANTICAHNGITYNESTKQFRVGEFIVNDSPTNSNFIGLNAGLNATNACDSNFLGRDAGYYASSSNNSNFFGRYAAYFASSANGSNFFGYQAGCGAYNSCYSNFLGYQAGNNVNNTCYSNFLGANAGDGAINATFSNFLGYNAGYYAIGATTSNFLGNSAGYCATNVSFSNLLGYKAGSCFTDNNIGCNNIIIGTNISLPNGCTDSINIGGVLFGSNTYSTPFGNPFISGSTGGKIGVGKLPTTYPFEVCGDMSIDGNGSGIVLCSPDGTAYCLTVANGGTLSITAV